MKMFLLALCAVVIEIVVAILLPAILVCACVFALVVFPWLVVKRIKLGYEKGEKGTSPYDNDIGE